MLKQSILAIAFALISLAGFAAERPIPPLNANDRYWLGILLKGFVVVAGLLVLERYNHHQNKAIDEGDASLKRMAPYIFSMVVAMGAIFAAACFLWTWLAE